MTTTQPFSPSSILKGACPAYPRDALIHEVFEAVARQTPDAVAVISSDSPCTYNELNTRATALACRIREAGIDGDAVVGLFAERSLDAIVAILAILKAGGAYLPLDPTWPEERLRFMLTDAGATIIIARKTFAEKIPAEFAHRILFCDDSGKVTKEPAERHAVRPLPGAEDLAYIMYTSGSTGRPKGIAVTHRNVVRLVLNTDYVHLGPDTILLQYAPLFFDASTFEIWGPLLNGGCLVIPPSGPLPVEELGKLIEKWRVTTLWLTSGLFHAIAAEALEIFRPLNELLAGGDILSSKAVRRVLDGIDGITVINGYGPTENTTFTCCQRMTKGNPPGVTVPIGRPIANTTVYILDANLRPVLPGEAGKLCTGGDGVAKGYLNLPDLTRERFVADPFSSEPGARMYRTGDLARLLSDGNIEFLGRIDRQVKVRGFRIELDEIEVALSQHESMQQAAITTHDFGPEDRRIIAYYTSAESRTSLDQELRTFLRAKLPAYMLPHHFIRLDALPLTPNGKVDRKALPDPSDFIIRKEATAPLSETERQVAALMAEVLHCGAVDPDDDFFALGGHSLLAFMLLARLTSRFGEAVSIRAFFSAPTVRMLAAAIEQRRTTGTLSVEPPLAPSVYTVGNLPQSFPQQRLWFLDRFAPEAMVYVLPFAFRLHGHVDPDPLQRALNTLVERHEALRTTFDLADGQPAQRINVPWEVLFPVVDLSNNSGREDELNIFMRAEIRKGFDLARGPLLRAFLIRMAEKKHVFFFLVHHIVFDGWSLDVFLRELKECYEAYRNGREPSLPSLEVQYRDFTLWQINRTDDARLAGHLAYWREALGGELPILDLPTDRIRPAALTYDGALLQLDITPELTQKLSALAHTNKGSLFMALTTVLAVLLFRYSGQRDILLGCPVNGRGRQEFEGTIGFFVNTLPIRFIFDSNPSFVDFFILTRETLLSALEHQDAPFERIVETANPPRHPDRTPLVQAFFAYEDLSDQPATLDGSDFRQIHVDSGLARTDLTVWAFRRDGKFEIVAEYNTNLFDQETMCRFLAHFRNLLEDIVARPNTGIEEFNLTIRCRKTPTACRLESYRLRLSSRRNSV